MKKLASVTAILLALSIALCGCSSEEGKNPEMQDVADAVGAAIDISDMAQIPDNYVTDIMSIALDGYAARNTIISSVSTNINEYGIFQGKDSEQAAELAEKVQAYLDYRMELWMDEYLPDEKPKLENAEVWTNGNYVMYAILNDSDREAVHEAFNGCF